MFHLAAFYQAVDLGGALTPINAVREEQFFTSGVDFRVPAVVPNIIGELALTPGDSFTRAQIQSPTLRMTANLDVEPLVAALVAGSPPECLYHPEAPVALTPDEALNFAVLSDDATPDAIYGLVLLSDGALAPVTGPIFSLRATASVTLAAGTWVNGNLTFAQSLPAGRYAVVGMRARGTNLVAARLVFPEQQVRPGVVAVNALGDLDPYWTRYGRMGVFGEFPHTNPPTIDCLGVTDSAQVVLLDIARVG